MTGIDRFIVLCSVLTSVSARSKMMRTEHDALRQTDRHTDRAARRRTLQAWRQVENVHGRFQTLRAAQTALKYPKGAVSLCTADVKEAFRQSGQQVFGCRTATNCEGTYPSQLPRASVPFFEKGRVAWNQTHTDLLLNKYLNGEDISPQDYPHAIPDFREALKIAPLPKGPALVGGSVSPWLEAALRGSGAKQIFTMDYDHRDIQTNMTEIVLNSDIKDKYNLYDAIVTFSSIEHDGLGRYCDPINPDGDHAAMLEFHQWLKPGGVLYLGIPVGDACILSNFQRIYDEDRFAKITESFKLLGAVTTHWGKKPWKGHNWQNQPWFVLQK